MDLKKQFIMGYIVATLLTVSNYVAKFHPSTRIPVIIFDLMIAFVLLRLAYKRLST